VTEVLDLLVRLLPGGLGAAFFVIAGDWLQTRGLNARRRLQEADDRVGDELAAPATKVYLAAADACADLGWQVYEHDDLHYTLWVINRAPHPGLRNVGMILHMTAFGSGETRVTIGLNSPHPGWVRRRFRAAAPRLLERLRLRLLEEEAQSQDPPQLRPGD
jgi:hypothetical protein